jgi:phosphonopyruvate decarboxylase
MGSHADPPPRVDRREFVARLMRAIPHALLVTGLGSPTYDVFAAGARPTNFYLWGAMGAACPLALGLALAQPDQSVVVVTGDGEMLMGIGSLATIAAKAPLNLTIVVLDNGHYGETGMQVSHTSLGTDLAGVAQACGIPNALHISCLERADDLAAHVRDQSATTFAQILVHAAEPPRALPPRDGVANKNAFRSALGFAPF